MPVRPTKPRAIAAVPSPTWLTSTPHPPRYGHRRDGRHPLPLSGARRPGQAPAEALVGHTRSCVPGRPRGVRECAQRRYWLLTQARFHPPTHHIVPRAILWGHAHPRPRWREDVSPLRRGRRPRARPLLHRTPRQVEGRRRDRLCRGTGGTPHHRADPPCTWSSCAGPLSYQLQVAGGTCVHVPPAPFPHLSSHAHISAPFPSPLCAGL